MSRLRPGVLYFLGRFLSYTLTFAIKSKPTQKTSLNFSTNLKVAQEALNS
jgi:hypothetical protein